jgi:hypothetical protein
MKTIVQKTLPGDVPFPWSEKDPYRLPVSIDRVQKMLITLGERRGGDLVIVGPFGGGVQGASERDRHYGWPVASLKESRVEQ